ncbi:hypothetical protein AC781_02200 [Akkermansia glycaniphila]|nr:hypothetical protein AC781_02200 [Akkermansia glycaniphila]
MLPERQISRYPHTRKTIPARTPAAPAHVSVASSAVERPAPESTAAHPPKLHPDQPRNRPSTANKPLPELPTANKANQTAHSRATPRENPPSSTKPDTDATADRAWQDTVARSNPRHASSPPAQAFLAAALLREACLPPASGDHTS